MPDKKRERYYLEALRTAFPDLPAGEPLEAEPPDFILQGSGGTLGIEITAFHLPTPQGKRPYQERQSLKDQVVQLAERIHHDAGGPALYVMVHFNDHLELDKRDIQPLANAIATSVLNAPVPQSLNETVEIPWGKRPEATWGILINPSVDGEDKLWHPDAGGWVASISPEQIADVVRSKARTAQMARTRCDKLWLVIVNESFGRAAPAEISERAAAAGYDGPFDRLIWLVPFHPPRVIDLALRSPPV